MMRIEELMKMTSVTPPPKKTTSGLGKGRRNNSTPYKGILRRKDRESYQVYTVETPSCYIGSTDSLEKALIMQAEFKPKKAPVDGPKIKNVIWAHGGYRARFVHKGVVFQRQGFPTAEEAAAWMVEEKAKHGIA